MKKRKFSKRIAKAPDPPRRKIAKKKSKIPVQRSTTENLLETISEELKTGDGTFMFEVKKLMMSEMIATVTKSNSGGLVEDDMVQVILKVASLEGKNNPVEETIKFLNHLSRKSLNMLESAMLNVKKERKTNSGNLKDALKLALDERIAHETKLMYNKVIKVNRETETRD